MTAQQVTRAACLAKARAELDALAQKGVRLSGNAFSSVLLVKDEPAGVVPLSGGDGDALRLALGALGYAPQDWAALSVVGEGGAPIPAHVLRLAVMTMDPSTVVLCDGQSAAIARDAFAEELFSLEDLDAALLSPGVVAHVLGMRMLNLDGFEASLDDPRAKQLRWHWLKQLRPLGEPF